MKENEAYQAFLDVWHDAMLYLMFGSLVIAFAIQVVYWLRYLTAKDLKSKYNISSQAEIKSLMTSNYFVAFALFCLINQTYVEMVSMGLTWKFTRIFIGIFVAGLHAYISYLVLKYYYPGPLEKRLKRLRYTPRINPSTGNKMKLLSEDEEDAYLDEGMQAEENAFSVDYDVWIDPETSETKIEKYKGHLHALECDRCGFQTLKLQHELVIRQATEYEDGELQKEYKCTYCGRVKRKNVRLAKKIHDHAGGKMIDDPLAYDSRIDIVRIEIKGSHGESKAYEFQNLYQAKLFLEEFKMEKLRDEEVY